jgi:hypothetical protein
VHDNSRVPPIVTMLRFKSSMKGKESLLPRNKASLTRRLRKFLPKDDNEDEVERCAVAESKSASLKHWEQCFLSGTVDDEHAEFIAGVLAKAREDIS